MLDDVIAAYIDCALWAGLDISQEDESGNNPPLDDAFSASDIAPEAMAEITEDCRSFYEDNLSLVQDIESERVGHDFYLTRNHHGAGFWDRGLGEAGDRLTDAAHVYGTSELYPGDDGLLYLSH